MERKLISDFESHIMNLINKSDLLIPNKVRDNLISLYFNYLCTSQGHCLKEEQKPLFKL